MRRGPASLRRACSFEIRYTAVYAVFAGGVGGSPTTRQGKALLIIPATEGTAPIFADQNGNYELVDATRVHRDGGRDAIDVRFRLVQQLRNSSGGTPFEIESLTCQVQLRVPALGTEEGSGEEELIVPTTAKGGRALKVEAVRGGRVNEERVASVNDRDSGTNGR